jgi:hypothetical protein
MSLFGKKDIKENDNKYIANILTNTASKIIKRGIYDRPSIEFLKLSLEYNVLIGKNEIDEDRFLTEKLDSLVKVSQEDAKLNPNMRGKDTISIFETLPDLIKSTKAMLKDKERTYEEMKKSAGEMIKPLDDILKELDKNDLRKRGI